MVSYPSNARRVAKRLMELRAFTAPCTSYVYSQAAPRSGMRLVDIAHGARLHHSTTHRILRALEQEGIVERLVNSRRYTIGSEVVWLGLGASSRFPIATAAARALDQLSEQVGDTVFLSVHSGNNSICADRRIGSYPIQVLSIAIGSRRPLGVSQGGRVILAFLPPRVAQQVIAENANRYARHDLTPGAVFENMNAARAQGYLCSDGVTVERDAKSSLCPF